MTEVPKQGILDQILENKRREIEARLKKGSNRFEAIFENRNWPAIIAEIKLKSPSQEKLYDGDPLDLVKIYSEGGAEAISIVTDQKYFGGNSQLFQNVEEVNRSYGVLPLLRKDFIFDQRQLIETKRLNADAVLLIVSAINKTGADLESLINLAEDLNIAPVVEVYDEEELDQAINDGEAKIIAVNARNLDTLEENIDQAFKVLSKIPKDKIALHFSGIKTKDDVLSAYQAGAKGVLVGTTLLKSENPQETLRDLATPWINN